MEKNLYFMQLFEKESGTYTYLLADKENKHAIIIDPVKETFERDLKIINQNNFKLKYIIETHVHADHITSSSKLKEKTNAKIILGINTNSKCADILTKENDTIKFGNFTLKTIETPGHTNGCTSYYLKEENMIFTGDTLLINSCGRVDFQEGNSQNLYNSLQKIFKLNNNTIIYPGHNYEGIPFTTIENEKKFNKFIGGNKTKKEFIELIENRKLPLPKKIDIAVPANLKCGKEN